MVHVWANAFSRLLSLVLGQRKNQGREYGVLVRTTRTARIGIGYLGSSGCMYISTTVETTYLNGGTAIIYFISTIIAQLPEFLRLDM